MLVDSEVVRELEIESLANEQDMERIKKVSVVDLDRRYEFLEARVFRTSRGRLIILGREKDGSEGKNRRGFTRVGGGPFWVKEVR